jgi:hypothetical protein
VAVDLQSEVFLTSVLRRVSSQHHVPADLPLICLLKRSCVDVRAAPDALKTSISFSALNSESVLRLSNP